ncbi:CrcB-like protein, Camphor resistance CrcB [Nitzschia inconspicua]|uniref:CrcB-like protein, Camphor resistance CrcB n=1 Tax=Nitzschia inconspicua TaxID=303405 RepID=A0A9K3KMJ0_9STRA|nr:CrcB-like protein, Camphor resistance CrcB [Nitzschia inconspicua]
MPESEHGNDDNPSTTSAATPPLALNDAVVGFQSKPPTDAKQSTVAQCENDRQSRKVSVASIDRSVTSPLDTTDTASSKPKPPPKDNLSPLSSIVVLTSMLNNPLPHNLSELTDGGAPPQSEVTVQPQSPSRYSPGGRKAIHDFFYPSRQQQQQQHTDCESNLHHAHDGENQEGQALSTKNISPKLPELVDLDTPSLPRNSKPISSILKKTSQDHDMQQFQDEHDDDDEAQRPIHMNTLSPLSNPRPRSGSRESASTTNRSGTPTAPHVVEEQEDKAFVEKFWTAYDEILILSLFTQIGILCRLGAASFFRYFDTVFQSDSALFTNLPLNCLSCFVMGMLCSGESLMQIIHTRFTPPRLQQDLHREATVSHYDDIMHQRQQQVSMEDYSSDEDMVEMETAGVTRRRQRRRKRNRQRWQRRRQKTTSLIAMQGQHREPEILQELREVQLLAWERRIRASVCLLLFPVRQEDVDVVENYFSEGYRRDEQEQTRQGSQEEKMPESLDEYQRNRRLSGESGDSMHRVGFQEDIGDFDDLILQEEDVESPAKMSHGPESQSIEMHAAVPPKPMQPRVSRNPATTIPLNGTASLAPTETLQKISSTDSSKEGHIHARGTPNIRSPQYAQVEGGNVVDYGTQENPDLDQIITTVATGVTKNISRIGRVNLAEGWDVGTSPQEKSEDLCLGLRDGLCGALSSFSSWISSMVNLFRAGEFGQAIVGLMLGIQLPLIAYRFGQYVSVYVFVWRCRREQRRDERRGGYGIQLHMDEEGSGEECADRSVDSFDTMEDLSHSPSHRARNVERTKGRRTVHEEESEIPSVRAIVTAVFIMCLVAQLTSLSFFYNPEHRLLALSLLFSPLGVLARWRMMKFNSWRPSFPIGTFACNVTACALSGTLGSVLAGNPGPRERIALVAIIAGFGGTLSSVARFIVEILSLMDPILFRLDGLYYAVSSAFWGLLVSFLFSASMDWADSV